jgi:hypothetical protein
VAPSSGSPAISFHDFTGQQNPDSRLPGLYPLDKEFKPRPVTPSFREIKPFDEHVEGIFFCCRDKSYAIQGAVQTDDFEDSLLGGAIRRNPRVLLLDNP